MRTKDVLSNGNNDLARLGRARVCYVMIYWVGLRGEARGQRLGSRSNVQIIKSACFFRADDAF